jgi:hypothetical protein
MATEIKSLVAGFVLNAVQEGEGRLLVTLTLYSFLFEDMLKSLLLRERKWVAQTMHPEERETIAIKPHYRACISRLWRTYPCQSDPANDAQYHYKP